MITNYKTAYDIEICGNCLKCGANVCHVIEKGKIITYDKYIREEKLNRILND